MGTTFEYTLTTEDKKEWIKGKGIAEIGIEKFKMIEKQCFEHGYSITHMIEFILENIKDEDINLLLYTMDNR